MLGGEGKGEDVCKAFQEIILKLLDVKLPTKIYFPYMTIFIIKLIKSSHLLCGGKASFFPESRKGAFHGSLLNKPPNFLLIVRPSRILWLQKE